MKNIVRDNWVKKGVNNMKRREFKSLKELESI